MFSPKKIAAVSGLLGGLALACAGAPQAYAAGSSGDCVRTAQGSNTCVHKGETAYTTKDGRHVIKQRQHCSSTSRHRAVWPERGALDGGVTRIGPVVDCSNRVPLPRGFKLPHFEY